MRLVRSIREWAGALLAVLQGIEQALHGLREVAEPLGADERLGTLLERVDALERNRAMWEAEVEATFIRAENERKNARAAEERARYKARKVEDSDGDEVGEQGELDALLSEANGARGQEGGVPPVRSGVGSRREAQRQLATRFKFGG